jgi:hypothetical protein
LFLFHIENLLFSEIQAIKCGLGKNCTASKKFPWNNFSKFSVKKTENQSDWFLSQHCIFGI